MQCYLRFRTTTESTIQITPKEYCTMRANYDVIKAAFGLPEDSVIESFFPVCNKDIEELDAFIKEHERKMRNDRPRTDT